MLIDNSLILDNNLTLTTSGSSTNYIDTIGAAGGANQISGVNTIQGGYDAYKSLWWEVIVTASMTAGGTSLDAQLWTSSLASAITGKTTTGPLASASVVKLLASGVINAASLTAKALLVRARLPVGCQEFLAGYYACLGTFSNGGTITSVLVPDVDINLT